MQLKRFFFERHLAIWPKTLLIVLLMNLQAQSQTPKKYLALGDSYTICESVTEAERWPNQFANKLTKNGIATDKPTIIATTGWRTDDLKNAILKAQLLPTYDLVSLLIGVNNFYQGKPIEQYESEFADLLGIAIKLAAGKKENVFVVSIPDYGFTPFGKPKQSQITAGIDKFNAVNKRVSEENGVTYYNITDISRNGLDQPDLVASDGLHPSGKQYLRWVERISLH